MGNFLLGICGSSFGQKVAGLVEALKNSVNWKPAKLNLIYTLTSSNRLDISPKT